MIDCIGVVVMKFDFNRDLLMVQETIKDKDIAYLKEDLLNLIQYINKNYRPYFSPIEMKNIGNMIHEKLEDIFYEMIQDLGVGVLQRQVEVYQTLSQNPYLIQMNYQKIKEKKFDHYDFEGETTRFNGTLKDSQEVAIESSFYLLKQEKQNINPNVKEVLQKIINKDVQMIQKLKQLPKEKQKEMKYGIMLLEGTEEEQLIKFIEYCGIDLEMQLRDKLMQTLTTIGKFLDEFGLLKKYKNQYDQDCDKLNMREMKYEMETSEDNQEDIGIRNVFQKESLKKYTTEQLQILNAFWQNRFTKEAENIMRAQFVFDSCHLWENIAEGKEIEFSKEELRNLLYKDNICYKVSERLRKKQTEMKTHGNYLYTLCDLNEVDSHYKKEYHSFFRERIEKSKNDFEKDIMSGQGKRNMMYNVYNSKSNHVKALLLNIIQNKKITNWGYMSELDNQRQNSIQQKKSTILVGVDYPGFNMPLRLHIKREDLIHYLKEIKGDTIIPMYVGENDFEYHQKRITTKILMPLEDKRQAYLIQKVKEVNPVDLKYQYIQHLGSLVTKKNKRTKKIQIEKWIDMENGQKGKMMKGEFIPDIKQVRKTKKEGREF